MRVRPLAAVAAVVAILATGCSADPNSVAEQAKAGDRKGYVSGDGAIEVIGAADRREPVELSGTTLDGDSWTSQQARGSVLVLNVWGSWCPPCVEEAPDLQRAWEQVTKEKKPVTFMGIDIRDSADSGRAFVASRKITYPSLTDPNMETLLSLQGKAATTPSTLLLDKDGKIAAVVAGKVSQATLLDLIDDVLGSQPA